MSSKTKHVPLRRCVSCGIQHPQRDLFRVVKTPEGPVVVDQEHKKIPGRGAYLCHVSVCWERALTKDRVGFALRSSLSPTDKEYLRQFADSQLQRQ